MWRWAMVWLVACACNDHVCAPPPTLGYSWPAGCSTVECRNTVSCCVACGPNETCPKLDCSGTQQCRLECMAGASCELTQCGATQACGVICEDGATCDVACDQAQSCSLSCVGGAHCLIRCASAASCSLMPCVDADGSNTPMVDCGGGVLACNHACP